MEGRLGNPEDWAMRMLESLFLYWRGLRLKMALGLFIGTGRLSLAVVIVNKVA